MPSSRDDFTQKTKDILFKRVSGICSNPECKVITTGPHYNKEKVLNLGIAAHITAASENGPRYDSSLSKKERKNVDNGIWLCLHCAKIIDINEDEYSVEVLKKWKKITEKNTKRSLEKRTQILSNSFLEKVEKLRKKNKKINRDLSLEKEEKRFWEQRYFDLLESISKTTIKGNFIDLIEKELLEGNFDKAIKILYLEEKVINENIIQNHDETIELYRYIIEVSYLKFDINNIIKYGKKVIEIYNKNLINKDEVYAQVTNVLASAYLPMRDLTNAEYYFKESIETREKIYKKNDIRLCENYMNLGILYYQYRDFNYSLIYFEKAKVLSIDDEQLSMIYYNIANLYIELNNFKKSYNYLKKSLIIIRRYTKNDHSLALCYNNISKMYQHLKKDEIKALKYLKKAKNLITNDCPLKALVYGNIGFTLINLKKSFDECYYYLNESLLIRINIYGNDHFETNFMKYSLVTYCLENNKIKEVYRILDTVNLKTFSCEINGTKLLRFMFNFYGYVNNYNKLVKNGKIILTLLKKANDDLEYIKLGQELLSIAYDQVKKTKK